MLRASQAQHPGPPIKLKLLMVIPVNYMNLVEDHLHGLFSTKRHHGEWFTLSREDMYYLLHFDERIELLPSARHSTMPPRKDYELHVIIDDKTLIKLKTAAINEDISLSTLTDNLLRQELNKLSPGKHGQ